jgi:hypothetical protein
MLRAEKGNQLTHFRTVKKIGGSGSINGQSGMVGYQSDAFAREKIEITRAQYIESIEHDRRAGFAKQTGTSGQKEKGEQRRQENPQQNDTMRILKNRFMHPRYFNTFGCRNSFFSQTDRNYTSVCKSVLCLGRKSAKRFCILRRLSRAVIPLCFSSHAG